MAAIWESVDKTRRSDRTAADAARFSMAHRRVAGLGDSAIRSNKNGGNMPEQVRAI